MNDYFDTQRYGWVRSGVLFPFEVWNNGIFLWDEKVIVLPDGSIKITMVPSGTSYYKEIK